MSNYSLIATVRPGSGGLLAADTSDFIITPEISLWRAVVLEAFWCASGESEPEPFMPVAPTRWARKGEMASETERSYRHAQHNHIAWRHDQQDKLSARAWLTDYDEDFKFVCSLAMWDPDFIRGRALILADKGWPQYVVERPDYVELCLPEPERLAA